MPNPGVDSRPETGQGDVAAQVLAERILATNERITALSERLTQEIARAKEATNLAFDAANGRTENARHERVAMLQRMQERFDDWRQSIQREQDRTHEENEKWRENANDWRGESRDRSAMYATRDSVDKVSDVLQKQIDGLRDFRTTKAVQDKTTWTALGFVITLIMMTAAIITVILLAHR